MSRHFTKNHDHELHWATGKTSQGDSPKSLGFSFLRKLMSIKDFMVIHPVLLNKQYFYLDQDGGHLIVRVLFQRSTHTHPLPVLIPSM